MTLSVGESSLSRDSYAMIGRAPRSYSELFYHRLLHRHPFARVLFPDDMTHQVEVFRRTIDALVDQLGDLASLQPTLADLAARHVGYGVEARHYAIIGEVLIALLRRYWATGSMRRREPPGKRSTPIQPVS